MNITVSKIKNRALRRIAIATSFPVAAILTVPLCLWNALIEMLVWWSHLASTARTEWRK